MTKDKKKEKEIQLGNPVEEPKSEIPTHYDIANRSCNLECLKRGKPQGNKRIKEPDGFAGLVKIVLVKTSKCEHLRRICWAGLIGLAYIMIGAVSTIVFCFSLAMKLPLYENLHILLCTAGFQLLIPCGILMLSDLNGPSVPMQCLYRRCNHVLLQVAGVGCGLAGGFMILFLGKEQFVPDPLTPHFFAGIIACILTALCALIGPCILFTMDPNFCIQVFGLIHKTLGLAGLLASSACLITGIMNPSFTNWLPLSDILYILIIFCAIYTIIVFLTPIIRCVSSNTEN